eukprot:1473979-Amphidinium_carterae.1
MGAEMDDNVLTTFRRAPRQIREMTLTFGGFAGGTGSVSAALTSRKPACTMLAHGCERVEQLYARHENKVHHSLHILEVGFAPTCEAKGNGWSEILGAGQISSHQHHNSPP